MLYAFAFERVGVVVGDLYFVDPNPGPGQEGAEHGVRLEVRVVERPELQGSIYSVQRIAIDRPIWRADLFETVEGPVGSHDRTHHHPRLRGWEPGRREWDDELGADPLGWVGRQLADLDALVARSEIDPAEIDPDDARQLREAVPEIVDAVGKLLARVRAGELGGVILVGRWPSSAAMAAVTRQL
ncbi:MAG TPA: hypothetical protein VEP49_14670, partial [Acidimicrobiia bacterium]|nr:hypothetical protein [Acidimicrobiia bacterium]